MEAVPRATPEFNLAGERPLLLAEVGLDTQRNGEVGQAQALRWLIQGAFASGCAGAFVFGWTDEWYRGGFEILDWDFGLTRRDRTSKAALETPGICGGAVPGGEVLAQHLGCGLQLQRPSHHSGYLEGLATLIRRSRLSWLMTARHRLWNPS